MTDHERFEMIVSRFEVISREGTKVRARCPVHGSEGGTLDINMGFKCVVLHCFAGCTNRDVIQHVGLSLYDTYYKQEPVGLAPPDSRNAAKIDKEETKAALLRDIFPNVEDYTGWTFNEDRDIHERLWGYCESYAAMIETSTLRHDVRLEITWLRLNTLLHATMWYHDLLMGNHLKAEEFLLKCDKAALRQFALVGIIKSQIFPKLKGGGLLYDYLKVCSRGIWAWERGLAAQAVVHVSTDDFDEN